MVYENVFSGIQADIDVSELNSGIYLLNVFTEKGSYEKKIVIQ